LCHEIDTILSDKKLYFSMKKASESFGVKDSLTKIYGEIQKLVGE